MHFFRTLLVLATAIVLVLEVARPAMAAVSALNTATHLFTPAVVDLNHSANIVRAVGRVVKSGDPVLVPEHPWEDSLFFFHSVIQVDNEIWMYYGTYTATGSYACLARSTDGGASFTKPSLGLVPYGPEKSTDNNIVIMLSSSSTLVTVGAVFIDNRPGVSPDARYKMTSEHTGNSGMDLWQSADGVKWTLLAAQALPGWFADTQPVVFWDNIVGEYRAYGRTHAGQPPGTGHPRPCPQGPESMRQVGYARSVGGLANWTAVETIFGFDGMPDCVDVYNSAAVQAANSYFMVSSEYRHFDPKTSHADLPINDGILDVRLAVSSDGTTWEWVSDETFIDRGIGELDPEAVGADWHYTGDWDSGVIFAARGFVETDTTLQLFYWGTQRTHGDYGKIYGYPNASTGIGRVTLRKNGWFSFDTVGSTTGVLVTTPLTVPTRPTATGAFEVVVLLNVLSSVRGIVRAELIDPSTGVAYPGYDLNSSVPAVGQNSLATPLRWASTAVGGERRRALTGGEQVQLRFEVSFSKLFSFELSWTSERTV